MARKADQYVIGVLFSTKTETTIKYVTSVNTQPKVAKWEDGKEAITFSKDYAKDLAFGLCMNGYAAIPMLKADYLELKNPECDKKKQEIINYLLLNNNDDDRIVNALVADALEAEKKYEKEFLEKKYEYATYLNFYNNPFILEEDDEVSELKFIEQIGGIVVYEPIYITEKDNERYVIGKDFNTKDWFVYDNETDRYIYFCATKEEAVEFVEDISE